MLVALFAVTAALGGQALAPAPAAAMDGEDAALACLALGGVPATGLDGQQVCVFNEDGSGGEIIRAFGTTSPSPPCPRLSSCLPSGSQGSRDAGLDGRDRSSEPREPKGIRGGAPKPAKAAERPYIRQIPPRGSERYGEFHELCRGFERAALRARLDLDYDQDLGSRLVRRFFGSERKRMEIHRIYWVEYSCDKILGRSFPTH